MVLEIKKINKFCAIAVLKIPILTSILNNNIYRDKKKKNVVVDRTSRP